MEPCEVAVDGIGRQKAKRNVLVASGLRKRVMSIELPEASILGRQMQEELVGKRIVSWKLEGLEKMVTQPTEDFQRLEGRTVESVVSRGNGIRVQLDAEMNIFLAPEYGGRILYHEDESSVPKDAQFMLGFSDDTFFSVRLKGWGQISSVKDSELGDVYVYARDFSDVLSPLDESFIFEQFSLALDGLSVNIKTALVGKDAVIVGIQNSAFQDIIYRAGIHPKRKVSDFDIDKKRSLFDAILALVHERIELGGKEEFVDLYSKQGRYVPKMGPKMRDGTCPACGTRIERLAHGGGHVYLCPRCQPI
jgi:formamidopyrimidine-DNA glycosylase